MDLSVSYILFVIVIFVQSVPFTMQQNYGGGGKGADVDRLLSDSKYVNKQINCVLSRGPCDEFGNRIIR